MPVRKDGYVLGNAAVAFDARGTEFVNWWKKKLGKKKIMKITGMPLTPIPSLLILQQVHCLSGFGIIWAEKKGMELI